MSTSTNQVWTIKRILAWSEDYLERHGDSNPRLSAQWLLSEACGLSRIDLYTNFDKPLTVEERSVMREWIKRRAMGEPLQLICGKAPFRYITLEIEPDVLIPRPETEVLVSEALNALNLPKTASYIQDNSEEGECFVSHDLPSIEVLDLCTGSGCIALSIASEYPKAHVVAIDISPQACSLAKRNAEQLNLQSRVDVIQNDLLSNLTTTYQQSFDLVISNPPYIPSETLKGLDREVVDYEPLLALDGGHDGLDCFRAFYEEAYTCLKPGGILAVELFETMLEQAAILVKKVGYERVQIMQDLTGRNRILLACKPL